MSPTPDPSFVHDVRIYYEDTDFSGIVYHANYLRYFERAREHVIGPPELVRLWDEEGVGFVVYRASLTFKEGARFGDELQIRTRVTAESDYRLVFAHSAWRGDRLLVDGQVDLVTVDRENKLVPLPRSVVERLTSG